LSEELDEEISQLQERGEPRWTGSRVLW